MATLTIQNIDRDGLTPAYVAANVGGDLAVCGQGSFLHVKNGSGVSVTVTVAVPGFIEGDLKIPNRAVPVPAGTETMIQLGSVYADLTDGLAHITYSAVTTVTVASIRGPLS